jgi:hypothetical protein
MSGAGIAGFIDRWRRAEASERSTPAEAERQPWPRDLAAQFKAVRDALAAQAEPADPERLASRFARARRDRVAEVLESLVSLGQARETAPGRYAP